MFKKENGITLIALVITIIVLLILAGVSISLVLGNNGVLTQATNAVSANREAQAKEEIQLAYAAVETEYWEAWANNSSLSKADFFEENNRLKNHIEQATENRANIQVTRDGDKFNVTYGVTDNSEKPMSFVVDVNGKIEEVAATTSNVVQLISHTSSNVLSLLNENSAAYDLMNVVKNYPGSNDSKIDAAFGSSHSATAPFVCYPSGDEFYVTDVDIPDEAYAIQLNDNNTTSGDVTVVIPKGSDLNEYTAVEELKVMFASNYSKDVVNGNINDSGIVLDVTKVNDDSVEFVLPSSIIGDRDIEGVAIVVGIYED